MDLGMGLGKGDNRAPLKGGLLIRQPIFDGPWRLEAPCHPISPKGHPHIPKGEDLSSPYPLLEPRPAPVEAPIAPLGDPKPKKWRPRPHKP